MRQLFTESLFNEIKENDNIVLLTGDLGFHLWDKIQLRFPSSYYNTGAAEQTLIDIAVGMAISDKIPFVYSITPFLLYRPFEAIRNYLNHEKIPVKLVGSGRDYDYGDLGFTHWAEDDKEIMKCFPNIECYWPNKQDVPQVVKEVIRNNRPSYINLSTK